MNYILESCSAFPSRKPMDNLLRFEDLAHNTLSVDSASKMNKMTLPWHCTCKPLSQDSFFQPSENLYFETFSSSPTIVGPIIHFGYERMSNKLSVNSNAKLNKTQERQRGGRGSRRPSCLSVRGAGGAKVPFLNAMICFLIVNMIQRRSYKLKASNIWLEKTIIYMTLRGIAHDIPQKVPRMPSISEIYFLA